MRWLLTQPLSTPTHSMDTTHTRCMSVMELGYHLSSQDSEYPGVSSGVGPDPVDLGM